LRIIRVPWAKGGKCTITAIELGTPEISTLLTPFWEHLSSRVTTRYVMYSIQNNGARSAQQTDN